MDAFKILIGFLLVMMIAVPAVSGIEQELGNGGVENSVWYGYDDNDLMTGCVGGEDYYTIDTIMYNANLKNVGWFTAKNHMGSGRGTYGYYCGNSDSDWRNMTTTPIPDSDSRAVTLYIGNDRIGSGRIAYNSYYTAGSYYLAMSFFPDATDWDLSGYSGTQLLNITYGAGGRFNIGIGTLASPYSNINTYLQNATNPRIGTFGNRSKMAGVNSRCHLAGGACGKSAGVIDFGMAGFYSYSFYARYLLERSSTTGLASLSFYKNKEDDTNQSWASMVYLTNGNNYIYWNETTINDVSIISEEFTNQPPLQVAAKDYSGIWWNGTILYDIAGLNNYQILIDNATITIGQALHPRIYSVTDVALSGLSRIHWQEGAATGGVNEIPVGGNSSLWQYYVKKSGTWYGWDETTDDFTNDIGGSAPNPISFSFDSAGIKTLYADIYTTGGTNFWLTKNVTVQGTDFCTNVIYVKDKSGAFVSGAEVDIQDLTTGVWTNQSTSTGIASYKAPPGALFKVIASKSGYEYDEGTFTTGAGGECTYTIITMSLFKLSTISTQCALYFKVRDWSNSAEIGNAEVTVTGTDPWTGSAINIKYYTNSAGVAEFNISNSTDLHWQVKKSGYVPQAGDINTGTLGYYQQVVQLVPGSVVTTLPTATPSTIVPTVTVTGGGTVAPNKTGFWAPFYKSLNTMGASDAELNIIMTAGLVIILMGLCLIGSGGNLTAANSGAALGFILSCAFGWILPWLIFAGIAWLLLPAVFSRIP